MPDLYRHLAACDVAVVQGGLTTTHGAHRAEQAVRLRARCATTSSRTSTCATGSTGTTPAGTCAYEDALDPDALAEAIVKEVGRDVRYRPVETDGAARAAALLADLV